MFPLDECKEGKSLQRSLSRFDMNNILLASGPDFKKGLLSDFPSGNIDVAPTVLWLLGVKPPRPMDGRVLFEALAAGGEAVPKAVSKTLEATRDVSFFRLP